MRSENILMIEFVEDRLGHDWRYAIDNTKIQDELNWFPLASFKKKLKELL